MPLTIELLPDPAANELRLQQLLAERSAAHERLNMLHGSGLQRVAAQRLLAESNGGGLAAIYGFTPVDLAEAAAWLGDAPERRSWPAGADLTALRQAARALPLERLNPDAPGVPRALLRTLTDLREAALSPDDLPSGDLRLIFSAWTETVAASADRSSRYEDAVDPSTPDSAFSEALGGAPVIVSGIYDLTRIQRLLLGRCANVTDVRFLLVAPSDEPDSLPLRTLETLRRELNPRVVRPRIEPAPPAAERYFSVGDPTAEADEIAARILELGRGGVAFQRIAVLHQQGAPADDRICAALERASIPAWRIGGRSLAQIPLGRAVLTMTRVLLDPRRVERSALLDWLSQHALKERPLGVERRPSRWERIALDAGLTRGLGGMAERLERWQESDPDAAGLAALIARLQQRSVELESADSWAEASSALRQALDDFFDDSAAGPEPLDAVRALIDALPAHDALGVDWSPSDGLSALNRAVGARVIREGARLVGGVNVGAASGPARGIRYDAVFVAGAAERVFPAVGRQDPLLPDDQRAAINARLPDALPLQRDRSASDRHAWALARRAAATQFSASWSRRGSAVGGPARPSWLLLESAAGPDRTPSEAELVREGRIARIESTIAASTPTASDVIADDWSAALRSPQSKDFELALLTAPTVDASALLPRLWPPAAAALSARTARAAQQFTDFDGRLNQDQLGGEWRPLERIWSAEALETFVACPYRFYLRYIVDARTDDQPERPDRAQQRSRGRLIERILAVWAREYEHVRSDRSWFEYADDAGQMQRAARRVLDAAERRGALGPPSTVARAREQMMNDLDRVRRREASDARQGWRPLDVELRFDDAPIRVAGGRTLRLRGDIDRVDVHVSGRQRALHFFSDRELPDVRGFVNGSSLLSAASFAALTQRGLPIRETEVEFRSVASRGRFESQTLTGEALTANDGVRLRDTLALIADQLESGGFIPYPGEPLRERPHCRRCPYESSCTADIDQRYQHKANHDPDAVRELETLRRQRL